MSRILTSRDILPLIRDGKTELELREGDNLTDLAREMLRDRGVRMVRARSPEDSLPGPDGAGESPLSAARQTLPPPDLPEARYAPSAPATTVAAGTNADGGLYDLVIFGGVCVIPEMGRIQLNVCIRAGKVAALTTERVRGRQEIDATGLHVLPGVIDPHTHLGLFVPFEQELESEPDPLF